jgi:DNA-binding CsgD family transcriptional regulator
MKSPDRDARLQQTELAEQLAVLCERLGVQAIIRDPASAEVLASVTGAEQTILSADPAHVNVIAATLGGISVRVESLRTRDQIWHEMTPRQFEVAAGLIEGLTNTQLSERLGISEHTVRRHVEGVFRYLGVGKRADAAAELERRRIAGTLPGRSGNGTRTGRDAAGG